MHYFDIGGIHWKKMKCNFTHINCCSTDLSWKQLDKSVCDSKIYFFSYNISKTATYFSFGIFKNQVPTTL